MRTDPERWLASLPAELSAQRALIARLLDHARADDRIRLFVVGCSIGRGAADRLSDVDALIGVRESASADVMGESAALVRDAGEVLDLYQQMLPATTVEGDPYQHTFAQYANGAQLDLVVMLVRETQTPRPDWVVLYDPDDRMRGEPSAHLATRGEVHGWAFNCLVRLDSCAKYLTRGSLWEAHLQLERAREDYWRVWAAAERVNDPQYGITAILDDPRAPLPAGVDATITTLDRHAIASAALRCFDLLAAAWVRAMTAVGDRDAPLPPLAAHVRERLRSIPT